MTITSKLLVRTLVVLIGLGIFVRGIWLSRTTILYSLLDQINLIVTFLFLIIAGTIFLVGLIRYIGFLILDYWDGDKQLFKPFKINFKFKKKND